MESGEFMAFLYLVLNYTATVTKAYFNFYLTKG